MIMRIHPAGHRIIAWIAIALAAIAVLILFLLPGVIFKSILIIISGLFMLFVLRFFRRPARKVQIAQGQVLAPADGEIVAIEEAEENELLHQKCMLVSVFMSIWDVHINWFPVSGVMKKYVYHQGKFLVARNPKSSTLNERTTVLLETENGTRVLVRQIAGTVARRIENYLQTENTPVKAGQEMGFIKFGSRVDLFLPVNTDVKVKLGDKVTGQRTVVANLQH